MGDYEHQLEQQKHKVEIAKARSGEAIRSLQNAKARADEAASVLGDAKARAIE